MDFKRLEDYIKKMRMMHIYQPVMIKSLIQSNGKATPRKIAKEFLAKDQSQIEYYTEITKNMPGKVLRKNGIVNYKDGSFELDLSKFTEDDKKKIIKQCDEEISKYEEKYGKKIWKQRARAVRSTDCWRSAGSLRQCRARRKSIPQGEFSRRRLGKSRISPSCDHT